MDEDAEPPDSPRSAVVVNPAKVADVARLRRVVTEQLLTAGWPEPTWFETAPEDPGGGQARQAIADGAEVVFVSGGDGTVTACVGALAGTDVALCVLPAGTGNLLAANLDVPFDPAAGVLLATGKGRRRLDVGMADDRAFVVMAGMGFDAAMVAEASDTWKARVGVVAYVWSGLRQLLRRPMRVTVRLDGTATVTRRARTVLVGNVGRLQGGLRLLADAQPDDGRMDVAIVAPRTLRHWARLAWAVLRRRERVPHIETRRAGRVEIVSTRSQPRQLDGDPIPPGTTLRVEVRPRALVLCVPQPEETSDMAEGVP